MRVATRNSGCPRSSLGSLNWQKRFHTPWVGDLTVEVIYQWFGELCSLAKRQYLLLDPVVGFHCAGGQN